MNDNRICPETHLTKSILVTVFCCLPFGIAGIIHASKVASSFAIGNYEDALQKSRDADKWCNIGIVAGLIYFILYFVIILLSTLSEI